MNPDAIDFLASRRSTPSRTLAEPGPNAEQLAAIIALAIRVPDHGRLLPWRIVRIAGAQRHRLGEQLAEICRRERPDAQQAVLEKERGRFSFAPVVLAVIARITPGHKIPEIEQRLSGGAVCFQLLLAAHAHGFGAQWLTSWAAYHRDIHAVLGLTATEEVLGFIHIGTASTPAPERERPDATSLLSDWTG